MSNMQIIITILVFALATASTRFIPFLVFGKNKKTPAIIEYLGKMLPSAMMGLLVVYCFKDINYTQISETLPAAIASISVLAIHLWKKNTILSITIGTAVYMILIRII